MKKPRLCEPYEMVSFIFHTAKVESQINWANLKATVFIQIFKL